MRVLLLNPQFNWPCGVRDFVDRLYCEFQNIGVDVTIYRTHRRGFLLFRELRALIRQHGFDIIHLQYPISSLRPSPIQHFLPLCLKIPVVVTLHEYSELNILRRLSISAFLAANKLVFTNEHEFRCFSATYPFIRPKTNVIPIGSNIPVLSNPGKRHLHVISYFGLIRPNKGLDQFLELAELSERKKRTYTFKIIGSVPKRKDSYYRTMLARSAQLKNIQWKRNLDAMQVAKELAMSGFAYLWYPDGASERRGSLLATLENGAIVITRHGRQTPDGLEGAVIYSDTCEHVLSTIDRLVTDNDRVAALRKASAQWVSKFTWHSIATEYRAVYASVIGDHQRAIVTGSDTPDFSSQVRNRARTMNNAIRSVSIVLLNWNRWPDTNACIDSLKRLNYGNFDIIVVDNDSSDDSLQCIAESHPDICLLRSKSNVGFARGCNIGIRHALKAGSDYVWLLNNDTTVEPGALTAMVNLAESDNRLGAVGSILFHMDRPEQIQAWGGGTINLWTGRSRHRWRAGKVDYLTGASMLLRKKILESVGLLDEQFFMYWEDSDLCFRIRAAGWHLGVATDSHLYHKESASSGKGSRRQTRYFNTSAIRFYRKHAALPFIPMTIGVYLSRLKRLACRSS